MSLIVLKRICTIVVLLSLPLSSSGCAIHYYSKKTGVEHLIGFGHMKMKTTEPNEDVRAVVSGTRTIGVSGGTHPDGANITAGYNRTHRLAVIDDNTSVLFEWPTSDFFSVRVGSLPPYLDEETKEELLRQQNEEGKEE